MVNPGGIYLSRPNSERVLLGLSWREIFYLGSGLAMGLLCSFYVVGGDWGLLLILMLPALALALAKAKIYGQSPPAVLLRAISLKLRPLPDGPTFGRSVSGRSLSGRSVRGRSLADKGPGVDINSGADMSTRGNLKGAAGRQTPKRSHRSKLEAPTHRDRPAKSPALRVIETPSMVAMVTNGAKDAVVYRASYCPTWSKATDEAIAESQIWATSIIDHCSKLPKGAGVTLRFEVVAERPQGQGVSKFPPILRELEDQLKSRSYRLLTHLALSIPHKSTKGPNRNGLFLGADGGPFDKLTGLLASDLQDAFDRWTLGPRSGSLGVDPGKDLRIRELWDRLIIDSTKICVLEVIDWPSAALAPGFLWTLLKPAPPTRTLTVEFAPYDHSAARRRIRSRSSELVAQRYLRERSGYLEDATDRAAERSRKRQEEELVQGESLVRFGAVLCVYSESSHALKGEVEKTIQLAQSIGVELRIAYGFQKVLFESSFFTGGIL